ncbi:MAG: hypothetical protein AB1633_05595, partial [Elusimicrobiota bacterium]
MNLQKINNIISMKKLNFLISILSIFIFLISILLISNLCLYGAALHTITVDGDLSDWVSDETIPQATSALYNPNEKADSVWDPSTRKNELRQLYVTWDKQAVYIGIEYSNDNTGLLVYIDVDSGTLSEINSGTDALYYISTWNRKVKFVNYRPDFFYGSWSGSSGNLYKITSSTSVSDISSYATFSTGRMSATPGSEIKIPWSVIYGGGKEDVPKGTRIALFAALSTGDLGSELFSGTTIQYGYLGGDCIPDSSGNNVFTLAPSTITDFAVVEVDSDLDGIPDDKLSVTQFSILSESISNKVFSPYGNYSTFNLIIKLSRQAQINIKIFDTSGNL